MNSTLKIKLTLNPILELLVFILFSCSDTSVELPDGFVEVNLTRYEKGGAYTNGFTNDEYVVENNNGNLVVSETIIRNKTELNLPSGKLIGIDEGEWGGQLNFVSTDSAKLPFEVKNGNITQLFKYKNEIFLIDGLSHMGYDKGALFKLNISTDTITYDLIEEFDSNPKAFTIYNEKYYIINNKHFIVIDNMSIDTVIDGEYWKGLNPNSIAVFDDNIIFIGMRGAIAKVNRNDKSLKFYREIKN